MKIFNINPLTYIFALLSIMTASFKEFFIISFLIIIHELGHTIIAIIFKIEIKEIYIYPLGGISKFNMNLNINPIKEFLILIMGPIFQTIAYYILLVILKDKTDIIRIYHISILGFNLLPIYPLDGGKILKLILDRFISFRLSYKIVIIISYILVFIIWLINKKNMINIIIMVLFLIILINKENKKIDYYYQKFILERYLNNYSFKKSRIITNIKYLYRNRKHLIKENDKYYYEKEYLEKMYKN